MTSCKVALVRIDLVGVDLMKVDLLCTHHTDWPHACSNNMPWYWDCYSFDLKGNKYHYSFDQHIKTGIYRDIIIIIYHMVSLHLEHSSQHAVYVAKTMKMTDTRAHTQTLNFILLHACTYYIYMHAWLIIIIIYYILDIVYSPSLDDENVSQGSINIIDYRYSFIY